MQYTNEQLKELLASNGKVLTEKERQELAEFQTVAVDIVRQQYAVTRPEIQSKAVSGVDRALLRVPAFVNFISDIGNTLTTVTQAMIPASLPFLLVFLIFAEAERVRYGVALFEVHSYLAYIVAYILVIGNAFVELAIQHKHHASGYERTSGYQFSFRIWAARAAYVLGFGENWERREKSPALRLERLQRALTAAILFLAIGGSMTETIQRQDGSNWRQGLVSIAVDSTLLELLTWLSGLVAAVVIVLLAQAIVAYAYGRASEYYFELIQRKAEIEGDSHPDLDRWTVERDQAIKEARQATERELLLKVIAKKGIELHPSGGKTIVVPKAIAPSTNGKH